MKQDIDVAATVDAVTILVKARYQVAGGSSAVWAYLERAAKRLDAQVAEFLKDQERVDDEEATSGPYLDGEMTSEYQNDRNH